MEEINFKAYNAFIAIRVSANTSTITAIANYTKHEIELTTHRKYIAPYRGVSPTLRLGLRKTHSLQMKQRNIVHSIN